MKKICFPADGEPGVLGVYIYIIYTHLRITCKTWNMRNQLALVAVAKPQTACSQENSLYTSHIFVWKKGFKATHTNKTRKLRPHRELWMWHGYTMRYQSVLYKQERGDLNLQQWCCHLQNHLWTSWGRLASPGVYPQSSADQLALLQSATGPDLGHNLGALTLMIPRPHANQVFDATKIPEVGKRILQGRQSKWGPKQMDDVSWLDL